ncbi:putative Zn-finger protein [Dioscorea alata]|uniref:Zn-finger protein n=1 Tax=Dioscorea alata TaxID=55571 RepID=A0ACB7V2I7_DIOAL|nr:putative Zn-finger protein [Dioscorea alata]
MELVRCCSALGNMHQSMGLIPCLKGCGFFGDPEQRNLCSQCYKDEILAPVRASIQDQINQEMAMMNLRAQPLPPLPPIKTKIAKTKRCESCKRKIGLTGFRCKCGGEFCSAHRLPEYCRKMPCSRSNCGFSLQIRSKWVLPHFAFRANSERHRCHRCLSWAYRHEATV